VNEFSPTFIFEKIPGESSVYDSLRFVKRNLRSLYQSGLYFLASLKHSLTHTEVWKESEDRQVEVVVRYDLSDFQSFYSKRAQRIKLGSALFFNDQSQDTPVSILISVFLGTKAMETESLEVRGRFVSGESNSSTPFILSCGRSILVNVYKPTYWFDFTLEVPRELRLCQSLRLVIDSIKIDNSTYNKKRPYFVQVKRNAGTNAKNEKPLVLFLSLDALSAADIENIPVSRNAFLELAKDGVKFDRAISPSSVTLSSVASHLTGLGLSRHQLYEYPKTHFQPSAKTLSPAIPTLAETLLREGYQTFATTNFSKLRPHFGFSRGFLEYRNICSGSIQNYPYLSELQWNISSCSGPLFMYGHLCVGGHPPFAPLLQSSLPPDQKNVYLSTISMGSAFLLSLIAFLKHLGLYDKALLIVTSDHGRSLEPYNRKAYQFDEERLNVPLLIKPPFSNSSYRFSENLKDRVCVTDVIYEAIVEILDLQPIAPAKEKSRMHDGVYWMSETIDYNGFNRIGLCGYDSEYKWVLYFKFDAKEYALGEVSEVRVFKLSSEGRAIDDCEVAEQVAIERKNRVVSAARAYLLEGFEFAHRHLAIPQFKRNRFISQ
jgi:hypothetical protein